MSKLTLNQTVEALLKMRAAGDSASLLGIGPMSSALLQAVFELARDHGFPPMFIASRNQVDSDEFGAGYVNGWDQARFASAIAEAAHKAGYEGDWYLCRDHGGPWQRDEERNAHLAEDEAMDIARRSFLADMLAGFDLLMVDPTKDPYQIGKVIPLETVLSRTVELIEWCEAERNSRGLPELAYEVGTEETNGGLTTCERYREFIEALQTELRARDLPMPAFIVGQTGTLTRKTEQVGRFDYANAHELSDMAASFGVGLKEHNGDYLDDASLMQHIPAGVTAVNVAPQYGTEETRAYLELCATERRLAADGVIEAPSRLREVLLDAAIRTERWRKWMVGDGVQLTVDEILADEELSAEVLDISGHYAFNDEAVRAETEALFANLEAVGIDGRRFVVERIKRPLLQYIVALRMDGVTTRIRKALGEKSMARPEHLEAVLFDFDGTLADTEPAGVEIDIQTMADVWGIHPSLEELHTMVGTDGEEQIPEIFGRRGIEMTADEYWEIRGGNSRIYREFPLELFEGAYDCLKGLAERGVRLALVSTTNRADIEAATKRLGILDFFEVTVCGGEAPAYKPSPAPYLYALELLGVSAEHALAVEDSPAGIASAKGAGLHTIGFCGSEIYQDRSAADEQYASFSEFTI